MKEVPFLSKMVNKRVRFWASGEGGRVGASLYKTLLGTPLPPPPPGDITSSWISGEKIKLIYFLVNI